MRKCVVAIVAIILIAVLTMTFVGCKNKSVEKVGIEDFELIEMNIGAQMPAKAGALPIDKSMSAYEMFDTVVKNFYDADFAITQQYGTAVTTTMGSIETQQVVDVMRIRDGKGDATGNNVNGATYFADSVSYSNVTQLYEKIVINGEDKISFRNAKLRYRAGGNTIEIKNWNNIDTAFDSVADFENKKSNNPTVLWMYDLKEENMSDYSQPIYDEESGTYRFSILFNPVNSTEKYRKTMVQQLEGNAGMTVNKIDFQQLRLRVVLWENGMIRNIHITESYDLKLAGGFINNKVMLKAEIQFSYDKNESGYNLEQNIKSFYDANAEYSKPYGGISAQKLLSIKEA